MQQQTKRGSEASPFAYPKRPMPALSGMNECIGFACPETISSLSGFGLIFRIFHGFLAAPAIQKARERTGHPR